LLVEGYGIPEPLRTERRLLAVAVWDATSAKNTAKSAFIVKFLFSTGIHSEKAAA
jgi:hypothetical protein